MTILTVVVNCVETVNPGKKAGRPVVLELQPNFDILSQMKSLHIQFLDDQGMSFLGCHWETKLTSRRSESILRVSDQSDVIIVPYADTSPERSPEQTIFWYPTTGSHELAGRHRHKE